MAPRRGGLRKRCGSIPCCAASERAIPGTGCAAASRPPIHGRGHARRRPKAGVGFSMRVRISCSSAINRCVCTVACKISRINTQTAGSTVTSSPPPSRASAPYSGSSCAAIHSTYRPFIRLYTPVCRRAQRSSSRFLMLPRAVAPASGDDSNPVALPPPVPIRAVLSAKPDAARSGRFPGVFGADLLTGLPRRRPKIALRRPILSGPPDFAVLVRNAETQVKGRFQRGRRLPWFEPHLPKIVSAA
jgi:hypothetical protein